MLRIYLFMADKPLAAVQSDEAKEMMRTVAENLIEKQNQQNLRLLPLILEYLIAEEIWAKDAVIQWEQMHL